MTAPITSPAEDGAGREVCAHCGTKLTAEEREFYGTGCERCECELHAAEQEDRGPVMQPPGREPGQLAYEARFAHLGPRYFDPWRDLEPGVKAIWAKVERDISAAAEAEVARLTKERDEARDGWERWKGLHAGANTVIRQLEKEIAALRAEPLRAAEEMRERAAATCDAIAEDADRKQWSSRAATAVLCARRIRALPAEQEGGGDAP